MSGGEILSEESVLKTCLQNVAIDLKQYLAGLVKGKRTGKTCAASVGTMLDLVQDQYIVIKNTYRHRPVNARVSGPCFQV